MSMRILDMLCASVLCEWHDTESIQTLHVHVSLLLLGWHCHRTATIVLSHAPVGPSCCFSEHEVAASIHAKRFGNSSVAASAARSMSHSVERFRLFSLIPILWLGLFALLRLLLLRPEGWALSPRQPLVPVPVPLVRPRVGPHQDEPTVVPEGPNEVRLRILEDLCATPHGVVVTYHLEVRCCRRRPLRGRLLRRCLHRRRRIAASALGWLSPRRHYMRTRRDAASAARASVLRWC